MNNIDYAYSVYCQHINDQEKFNLLKSHGLKVAGSVPSVLWELFASILTGRNGSGVTGADLVGWEVKSAKIGSSFEYQYHLNTGHDKLLEDSTVNHLFCSYSETYKDVYVRIIRGSQLSPLYFQRWTPEYNLNYSEIDSNRRRQRFRRSIPYNRITQLGTLALAIEDGIITYRDDRAIPFLNRVY